MAVAASVILIFGTGWLLHGKNNIRNNRNVIVKQTKIANTNYTAQSTIIGNSKKIKITTVLPDGSQVVISPNSQISFNSKFNTDKRELVLVGQAFFKVAKNKLKPFIVYSRGISTTALGTSFTITAFNKDKFVKVVLYTGKVVISSADAQTAKMKDVYLVPGQNLLFNTGTSVATVERNKTNDTAESIIPQPSNTELDFVQEPLAQVFDMLNAQYNLHVEYDADELSGLSFTGKIRARESAEKMLEQITQMNELKLMKTGNGYHISKQKL